MHDWPKGIIAPADEHEFHSGHKKWRLKLLVMNPLLY